MNSANRVVEILNAAKEAFTSSDHEKVAALLVPLKDNENVVVAGTASYIAGLSLYALKRRDEAFSLLQHAVDIGYDDPALYEGYGASLQQMSKYGEAEEIYLKGIEVCGRKPTLLSHWASIEILRGNITHAEELLKEALKRDDTDYMGWTNLGNLFQLKAHYRDAVGCYKEALKISPTYDSAISNLLLTSNYTRLSKSEVFEAHKTYCDQIIPIVPQNNFSVRKHEKIRIGYVSGDFKTHSVSYFFAPILQNHSSQFEIYCYSDVYSPDPVTLRFQQQCHHWCDSSRLSDQELYSIIKNDEIDILVDLSGHANSKRLALYRSKPAPAITTYLGYPNTLGVAEVKYRIVDEITDPIGDDDQFYREKRIRIPSPFITYMPPADLPEIKNAPYNKNGFITFGSFNNLAKLSDETVEIWSQLLKSVPTSKLCLKSKPLKDDITAEETLRRFEFEGIERSRITLLGHRASNHSHLELYNDIDIALDCFPYNGTTTTCEALVMGVPVVTICGDRHSERVSTSILHSIGHPQLSLDSKETFLDFVEKLTFNTTQIDLYRSNLRNDLLHSRLGDGAKVTAELEKAYVQIFEETSLE